MPLLKRTNCFSAAVCLSVSRFNILVAFNVEFHSGVHIVTATIVPLCTTGWHLFLYDAVLLMGTLPEVSFSVRLPNAQPPHNIIASSDWVTSLPPPSGG